MAFQAEKCNFADKVQKTLQQNKAPSTIPIPNKRVPEFGNSDISHFHSSLVTPPSHRQIMLNKFHSKSARRVVDANDSRGAKSICLDAIKSKLQQVAICVYWIVIITTHWLFISNEVANSQRDWQTEVGPGMAVQCSAVLCSWTIIIVSLTLSLVDVAQFACWTGRDAPYNHPCRSSRPVH